MAIHYILPFLCIKTDEDEEQPGLLPYRHKPNLLKQVPQLT